MLTDDEKAKVRRALGYFNAATASSIMLGVPRPAQPLFLVEQSMGFLLPAGETEVRRLLAIIDSIDDRMLRAHGRLAAEEIGEIVMNPRELTALKQERFYWAGRLSDEIGAPMNEAYAMQYRGGGGGQVTTANVQLA